MGRNIVSSAAASSVSPFFAASPLHPAASALEGFPFPAAASAPRVSPLSADFKIPAAAPPTNPAVPDNYASQIVKLIPAEIVGVYLGLQNTFSSLLEPSRAIAQIIIFLVILGIAPFYLKLVAGITDTKQKIIAIVSYCIWGISLGGPFEYGLNTIHSAVSAQLIGGALIMLYTLIVPLLYKLDINRANSQVKTP